MPLEESILNLQYFANHQQDMINKALEQDALQVKRNWVFEQVWDVLSKFYLLPENLGLDEKQALSKRFAAAKAPMLDDLASIARHILEKTKAENSELSQDVLSELENINVQDIYLGDRLVKITDDYWCLCTEDNQHFVYENNELGAGLNGRVHLAVDMQRSAAPVIIKMQCGSFDEKQDFIPLAESRAKNEHRIAQAYKPDGQDGEPLGIKFATVPCADNFESQVFGDLPPDQSKYAAGKNVYLQVQRFIPGTRLDELALITEPSQFKKIARSIIQATDSFQEQTSAFHGDVRPENILVDNNGKARYIDPGAAMLYDANKIAHGAFGYTKGFSHPEIMANIKEDSVLLDAYTDKYESYSVCKVLELVLKKCDSMVQAQFASFAELLTKKEIALDKLLEGLNKVKLDTKILQQAPKSSFQLALELWQQRDQENQARLKQEAAEKEKKKGRIAKYLHIEPKRKR